MDRAGENEKRARRDRGVRYRVVTKRQMSTKPTNLHGKGVLQRGVSTINEDLRNQPLLDVQRDESVDRRAFQSHAEESDVETIFPGRILSLVGSATHARAYLQSS